MIAPFPTTIPVRRAVRAGSKAPRLFPVATRLKKAIAQVTVAFLDHIG
jgi:hypothetical protein